jgi:hypothetical protein
MTLTQLPAPANLLTSTVMLAWAANAVSTAQAQQPRDTLEAASIELIQAAELARV